MANQESNIECYGVGDQFRARILLTNYSDDGEALYYKGQLLYPEFDKLCRYAGLNASELAQQHGAQLREHRTVAADMVGKLGLRDVTADYQMFRTRVVNENALQDTVNECQREGYEPHQVSAPHDGRITAVFCRRQS